MFLNHSFLQRCESRSATDGRQITPAPLWLKRRLSRQQKWPVTMAAVSQRSQAPHLVDTLGLLLQVIRAANVTERGELYHCWRKLRIPTEQDFRLVAMELIALSLVWLSVDWEVVKRKQSKGFKVLPWRWIVRTLALVAALQTLDHWLKSYLLARKLSSAAMVRLMVRRLAYYSSKHPLMMWLLLLF